jgi:hypothetical protein
MNENDIEHKLRQETLAEPSPSLDQRMDASFDKAASTNRRPLLPTVPLWLAAAACLTCGFAGFGARSLFVPRPNPPTVVYVFPPSEAMTHLLGGGTANRNDGFDFSHARIQVINLSTSTEDQL